MDVMPTPKLPVPPEFDAASMEQRIQLVQDLWDRIAQDQGDAPVPDSHKQILDERLNADRAKGEGSRSWEAVCNESLTKLRDG